MSKMRHRKSTLTIQQTINESFQGRMKDLDAKAKRIAIKQINPLFYMFGNQLTPLKEYLKEYDEPHH
jgi:hypothetical protein